MNIDTFLHKITLKQNSLAEHPLYSALKNKDDLKVFMEYHIFAVWDFMSLLKGLQREITCVTVPWKPSAYPGDLVRFINEIVLGEESDSLPNGEGALCHFNLYLKGMNEIGANTESIESFLVNFDIDPLSESISDFVSFTLNLVKNGSLPEIAASFLFGRESLIPKMYQGLLDNMKVDKVICPSFVYYVQRHIEIDGGEHSLLAEKCLKILCGDDEIKWELALKAGLTSLEKRQNLWDSVYAQINELKLQEYRN